MIDQPQVNRPNTQLRSRFSGFSPFFAAVKQYPLDKKLKILLNYIVGPILFVWLSVSIYQQIQSQGDVQQSWRLIRSAFSGQQLVKITLVFALMLVNWGIEARKWQYLMNFIQKISFRKALKAVFAGQALGFNTPNRVGEPAGRVIFLDEGNRLRGMVLSIVGGMSQTIVIFVSGLMALSYFRLQIFNDSHRITGLSIFWLDGLIYTIIIGTILFMLLYFRLSWTTKWFERIPLIAKHKFFVEKVEDLHWKELTRILVFSFFRYVVIVVQYVLMLQVFEVNIDWIQAAGMVSVMLFVLALVPTIGLAELGFRGKIGLQLFGMLSSNSVGIIAAAAGIWIINLIIPAITGSLFILGIRLFRNKST
ncbi:MAG: lysylphosphatidylglycerol synthase domain-containing protein [Sediminibacterium sp.]